MKVLNNISTLQPTEGVETVETKNLIRRFPRLTDEETAAAFVNLLRTEPAFHVDTSKKDLSICFTLTFSLPEQELTTGLAFLLQSELWLKEVAKQYRLMLSGEKPPRPAKRQTVGFLQRLFREGTRQYLADVYSKSFLSEELRASSSDRLKRYDEALTKTGPRPDNALALEYADYFDMLKRMCNIFKLSKTTEEFKKTVRDEINNTVDGTRLHILEQILHNPGELVRVGDLTAVLKSMLPPEKCKRDIELRHISIRRLVSHAEYLRRTTK